MRIHDVWVEAFSQIKSSINTWQRLYSNSTSIVVFGCDSDDGGCERAGGEQNEFWEVF